MSLESKRYAPHQVNVPMWSYHRRHLSDISFGLTVVIIPLPKAVLSVAEYPDRLSNKDGGRPLRP